MRVEMAQAARSLGGAVTIVEGSTLVAFLVFQASVNRRLGRCSAQLR